MKLFFIDLHEGHLMVLVFTNFMKCLSQGIVPPRKFKRVQFQCIVNG